MPLKAPALASGPSSHAIGALAIGDATKQWSSDSRQIVVLDRLDKISLSLPQDGVTSGGCIKLIENKNWT
jgi:hypothetical protein